MTTVVDKLQKLLAGPANLTTDEAIAVAMAIALLEAQAAQPAHALNWSELVAWWESGAEQWEGLRDIVSRMVAQAAQPIKDHETAKLVSDITAVATEFHDHQSLRERIAQLVRPWAQPVQPEGWKLVPVEPTPEMIEAGQDVEDLYRRGTPDTWGKVYRAMVRAAPSTKEQSNG